MGIEKGVISIEEFHNVAFQCGFLADINSEEFSQALEYFHHCGVVLHFASIESLKRIVILSPHWIAKLFSYVLIAHPYQRIKGIGGKKDVSFDILIEKGILVGAFLTFMLNAFNDSENKTGYEVQRRQTVDLLKKLDLLHKLAPKRNSWKKLKLPMKKMFILFLLCFLRTLPMTDMYLNKMIKAYELSSSIYLMVFYLQCCMIKWLLHVSTEMKLKRKRYYGNLYSCNHYSSYISSLSLYYRLRKGKIMMVLSPGQYYCVNLCRESNSIKLSFVLLPGGNHSAEQRIELLQYFQSKLEQVMEDFMSATTKAVAYVPCYYCSQLHMELKSLRMGKQQHCPKEIQPIPLQHYYDLVNDQGCILILGYVYYLFMFLFQLQVLKLM